MSPEGEEHADLSDFWRDELIVYKRFARPDLVQKVRSGGWVRVGGETDRLPDIAVYLVPEAPGAKTPDRVPDLVFEFVGPGARSHRRDHVDKRAEYQRLGIPEYVIVDRFEAKVTVLTLGPDGYTEGVLGPADTYTSPRLPGFAPALAGVIGP